MVCGMRKLWQQPAREARVSRKTAYFSRRLASNLYIECLVTKVAEARDGGAAAEAVRPQPAKPVSRAVRARRARRRRARGAAAARRAAGGARNTSALNNLI